MAQRMLYTDAEKHLKKSDPALGRLIDSHGPCTLESDPDLFRVMVRSIISQLISTAAARTIGGRFEAKLKGKIVPSRIRKLTDEEIQACGISGGKRKAIRGLAEHFSKNRGFAKTLTEADNDRVRQLILPLHGIGPWTADMVLMFGLGRLDVLPVGDMGLRLAVRDLDQLSELPKADQLTKRAAPWQPYRTIATWYLWRSRGPMTTSENSD